MRKIKLMIMSIMAIFLLGLAALIALGVMGHSDTQIAFGAIGLIVWTLGSILLTWLYTWMKHNRDYK